MYILQKVRTGATSQSLDSPSDSPHEVRDVGPAAEVGSAASSSISSFSHRQGHAWPHGEQQGQHSRQPLANGQRGAPGRAGRAATPAQGSGGPKDSSAALAAASAAAAAALRPHRGTGPGSHAGQSLSRCSSMPLCFSLCPWYFQDMQLLRSRLRCK